jgi:cytochrome c-type biogenesis protein
VTLEFSALPLAFAAGMVGILSPCVWPLVPVVMGSATTSGRLGPPALALGLSMAFAFAGTLLSFLLVSAGIDAEIFRYVSAILLLIVAIPLLHEPAADWLALHLRGVSAMASVGSGRRVVGPLGQLGIGFLLGLVWLPCVGPTLGAAIALASMGQQLILAFLVMMSFGLGTALMLLLAAMLSTHALKALRPQALQGARRGKQFLGCTLLLLGLLVLLSADKWLERWAIGWLPAFTTGF